MAVWALPSHSRICWHSVLAAVTCAPFCCQPASVQPSQYWSSGRLPDSAQFSQAQLIDVGRGYSVSSSVDRKPLTLQVPEFGSRFGPRSSILQPQSSCMLSHPEIWNPRPQDLTSFSLQLASLFCSPTSFCSLCEASPSPTFAKAPSPIFHS